MRLTDIVQHADLHMWAELALVLFLGAFAVIAIRVLSTGKQHHREMALTPLLDDDQQSIASKEGTRGTTK